MRRRRFAARSARSIWIEPSRSGPINAAVVGELDKASEPWGVKVLRYVIKNAIRVDGGMEAVQLRVAEQYVAQFGPIASKTNTVVVPANVSDVVPANVSDVAGMIATAMKVFASSSIPPPHPAPSR